MSEKQMSQNSQIIKIAQVCHEANRAWCQCLGDNSQPSWEEAPEWQRDSAEDGVKFHIDNPEAGHRGSHENWLRTKTGDGWVYGLKKDVTEKTHPCIVPFDELPGEQQMKDRIFHGIVHAMT